MLPIISRRNSKPWGNVTDYVRKIVILSTILVTLGIASVISIQELLLFRRISYQQREDRIIKQKDFIKDLIAIEVDYISHEKVQFDSRIAGNLFENVYYAYNLAEKLYHEYHGKISDAEVRKLIIYSVSALTSSRPYTRVFISSLDGTGIYYAGNPKYTGINLRNMKDVNGNRVIRNELELLKKKEEGYIWYDPPAKGGSGSLPGEKVTFVKRFEPLNWYFGSKCYLNDYYDDFKEEIAKKISSERFRYGGYVFLNEVSGNPIVYDGQIYKGAFNYYDGSDSSKMNVFRKEVNAALSSPEGGYFTYNWNKIGEESLSRKISYARQLPELNWIVGAGFYEEEVDAELENQNESLKDGMIRNLVQVFLILLIFLLVEVFVIYRFNKNYDADFIHFDHFFQVVKGRYEKMDIGKLHFPEFRKMGIVANEMIEERSRVHEQLIEEQKKAREADQLKTAFLANMSHEIRTPMNAIIGFSQLLEEETISKDEKRTFLNLILENGEILMNLIDDIIDIAKIESGQLKIVKREFNLDELLERIKINYQKYIIKHPELNIRFELEKNIPSDYRCCSDKFRLKQVLDNLIGNALKFTKSGFVLLTVSEKEGKLCFRVKDSGIGISPEDQEVIFHRFIQAKNHPRKNYGGTGLGLAISKSIVEQLGGTIGVKSTPGKGSEFYFFILA